MHPAAGHAARKRKMMQRNLTSLLGLIAIVLVACGGNRPADAQTFRWAFQSDIASLDPMSTGDVSTRNIMHNVLEPLVKVGPAMQLVPGLATSWERVNDTSWRFHLREGVKFHDGAPFTADDVVFSFVRAVSSSSDTRPRMRMIRSIAKADDRTVQIDTVGPSPTLLSDLTYLDMYSKSWAEANDCVEPMKASGGKENYASRHANGTGPFRVANYQPGVKLVLEANDGWWGERTGNVKQAIFTPIVAETTRVAALLDGQVDMIDPVPQQDVPRIQADPKLQVTVGPEARVIYLGMDQARDELLYANVKGKNPFKDIRVREAFYRAIDTGTIREKIMRGAAAPAATLLTSIAFGYDPSFATRKPHDPALAKKLLDDAGYPDGFEVTLDCPAGRYVNDDKICAAVAAMLAKVKIKVKVLAQAPNLYFQKIGGRDTSFYLHGWGSDQDAQPVMVILMHSPTKAGAGSWNVGGYANAVVDDLIDRIGREMDPQARLAMIKQAVETEREDFGVIPVHQQMLAWGIAKKVSVAQRPDDFLDLAAVRLQP
jgi:peptide/nickel transport system substrate-binding protein